MGPREEPVSCWFTAPGLMAQAGRHYEAVAVRGTGCPGSPIPLTSLSDDVAALDRAPECTDGTHGLLYVRFRYMQRERADPQVTAVYDPELPLIFPRNQMSMKVPDPL